MLLYFANIALRYDSEYSHFKRASDCHRFTMPSSHNSRFMYIIEKVK